MKQYIDLLAHILEHGKTSPDRTGTGTRSVFGYQMRFDLEEGFPLLTSKKVQTKSVIHELLWFLSGDTNIKYLNDNDVHIWDAWADKEGNLGNVYGKQWTDWNGVNQIKQVIHNIKTNPNSRRHIVSAWNVPEIDNMALPPCHCLYQFHVQEGKLSCQLYQRSADVFLGVPFNIASYALLTHMVAQQCDLEVGEFIWTGGDTHIYLNHMDQVLKQMSRRLLPYLPTLNLKKRESIFDYTFDDIEIENYQHLSAIPAPIAV